MKNIIEVLMKLNACFYQQVSVLVVVAAEKEEGVEEAVDSVAVPDVVAAAIVEVVEDLVAVVEEAVDLVVAEEAVALVVAEAVAEVVVATEDVVAAVDVEVVVAEAEAVAAVPAASRAAKQSPSSHIVTKVCSLLVARRML